MEKLLDASQNAKKGKMYNIHVLSTQPNLVYYTFLDVSRYYPRISPYKLVLNNHVSTGLLDIN